jgi:hypothetical protein
VSTIDDITAGMVVASECSCHDVLPRDGTVLSFDAFLADNTIFNKIKAIINYYLKHNYHIFLFSF